MKFCTKCGAPLKEGQIFCTNCGNKIINTITQPGSNEEANNHNKIDNEQQQNENNKIADAEEKAKDNKVSSNKTEFEGFRESVINDESITQDNKANENTGNKTSQKDKIAAITPGDKVKNSANTAFKISKRAKTGIIAACILIILGVSGYFAGNYLTKPSNVIANFKNDVAANNEAALEKILYCDDSRIAINKKSIDPLLQYFKEHPDYLNQAVSSLNNQASNISSGNILKSNSQNVFGLLSVGKKFLFFPDYKIILKPGFITVNASIQDVELYLNEGEIGKSDSDSFSKVFGPYLPGEYKLTANYKGKYAELNETENIDLVTAENNEVAIDVFKNPNYLNISCDEPDAELYVNNKDTGLKACDAVNFGPLDNNSKVYAVMTKDGQTLKSNEYTAGQGDNNDVYLSFGDAESTISGTENQLHDLIYWYTNSFSQAVNYNDFSIVEPYIYPGSSLYTEQSSYVPNTYNHGITEYILSFNITGYNINNDNKSGTITTQEVYNITKNGSSAVKTFNYKYSFKYNDETQSYQLASIAAN